MVVAMVEPPLKRRRLHGCPSQVKARWKHVRVASNFPSYAHGVEALDAAEAPQDGDADSKMVVPRQDTGLSILQSALSNFPAISASVSIGLDLPSAPPAVTSIVGEVTSILDPSSPTAIPSEGSSIPDSSTQDVPSNPVTPSPTEGIAGSTPTGVEATSSTNISTSNTTGSTSTPSSDLPVLTTSTSLSRNSTSSSGTRTTSSRSSITRDPAASTSTNFLATFSNGRISTFTRASQAYVTTVDGEAYTVPALQTITSFAYVPGGGQGTPTAGAAPTETSATLSSAGSGGGSSTPPAGTIAGGVVGGAAGLAVVVLIAMLAVRWYRRNGQMGHRALPAGSSNAYDADGVYGGDEPRGPGMAERAGTMPFAVAGLMRNQSQSAHTSSEPSERGFTRVSGRKLPSAFSGGMSSRSPPPGMPLTEHPEVERESNGSWYQENYGYYGADGESPPAGTSPEHMTMSPGPQRTPVIHSGGPYTLSPSSSAGPSSPQPHHPGFLGHSNHLLDPSRNSRFTEEM